MNSPIATLIALLLIFSGPSFGKSTSTKITPDALVIQPFTFHVDVVKLNDHYVFTVSIGSGSREFSAGTKMIPGTSVMLLRPGESAFKSPGTAHNDSGAATEVYRPLKFRITDETLTSSFRVSQEDLGIVGLSFGLTQIDFLTPMPGMIPLPSACDTYFFVLKDFLPQIEARSPK